MPRPRHPIREHFHEVPTSDRKNGAISCNYCGKEQSAGNPKRCQKHLDECPQYAQVVAVIDAGGDVSALGQISNYNNAFADGANGQAYVSAEASSPSGSAPLPPNFAASAGLQASVPAVATPEKVLTEDSIIRALRINDATYHAIERELDAQLLSLNISGAGLHTNTGRTLLKQAFYQVHTRWPDVFNDIPEGEKITALTNMANICNRKRRNGAPPSAGSIATSAAARSKAAAAFPSSPYTPIARMHSTPQPAIFGMTTIIAERNDDNSDAFVVCRPSDLIDEPRAAEDITVNDVRFEPFMNLLTNDDDVMFDMNEDRIMFTFTGGRTKNISNEIVWRVALEEMHRKCMDPFVFRIQKQPRV